MVNKKNKSKYWIKKWDEAGWSDFRELEVGSVFEASVPNHKQMADRIGDIIFWYRKDKDKGIYFITQVISAPYPGDNNTGYWMDLKILKTIIDNPVKPENHKVLNKLIEKINKLFQAGSTYNLTFEDEPEKIYDLIKGKEKILLKENGIIDIDIKDLATVNKIRDEYLKSESIFNPFIDTDLAKSEVRHLNFITNLINPNGSHLQGDKFLKLFLDELLECEDLHDNKYLQNFCNFCNIQVQVEKTIPNGRIDIYIENDEFIIAIEGKTETEDSKGQLKKYDDFLKEQNKPYLLFYLTKYGSKPKHEIPSNLKLMSFNNEIIPFFNKVLNLKNLPEKISYIIDEYYNALIVYIYNFTSNWTYDLDIINEIVVDNINYRHYENIKNNYFYNPEKYNYSIVEDIANSFDKSKSMIERNFFVELHNSIKDDLVKKSFFYNDEYSNILLELSSDDNINILINKDLETIYKSRIIRQKGVIKDKSEEYYDNLREFTKSCLVYENFIDNNESLFLFIQNDISGLHLSIHHLKNNDAELINDYKYIINQEKDIFNSKNIIKFLDEKYLFKIVDDCKQQILNTMREIN